MKKMEQMAADSVTFFSKFSAMKKNSLSLIFNYVSTSVFTMVLISPLHSIVDNGGGGYVDLDWKTPCWYKNYSCASL